MRATLAFYCSNLFLFFYNLTARLDDEFAAGLLEAMHTGQTWAKYRKATGRRD